ncbi:phage protein [Streptococcus dysgalactiae subsp. equisimilis]|uniref:DUF1642 domain-containing protein n=1 Tax=Streptococcus dysgalactiae TaxID=1334 RepID=UPI0010E76EC7|nr:DUF1642 domain-containing protein [Streptococcus dysgalactiae]VTT19308.1 phage protein [Streptococcus dysgalactiae subsp. equisimilis]VTT21678.1 phage protein [Streptococcus dysgalactiae subsp. equisimilis]
MNIEEVLYLPVKREGLSIGPDEFFCKHRYRTLDGDEVASSVKAKTKEELLDQTKPEIPQFVADWIEYCKKRTLTLKGLFSNSDMPAKIFDWIFGSDKNCRLMAEAWINGYTVEKGKLYKVRDKRLHPDRNYLNFDKNSECWFFSNGVSALSLKAEHTRKALEESGFNVFYDDNYEVIEVTK